MSEPELPRVLRDVEEIDADSETENMIQEALADLAADRSVICEGDAAFDALLDSLSAKPYPQAS
ncbi:MULTISPECIES: hypothetical protein [Protofrankia]|uniref:Uncharacterized protein n=1 Tax=Protofrankia coriariae TaxID=1562887 RepID=A0ABR5F8L5_9ACTN|nr:MULTISPECIES: hypothetical protein [Protofrankia]KLL13018.1 hypothetical protein FrCorBMG51_00230 [Protofrankia coriariae]ONH38285.1 hypothetical protein BL254_00605 [Protofrankia sp. BMG5.30]